jgi:hypothetical protein
MKIIKAVIWVIVSGLVILLFSTELDYDNTNSFDTISTFLSILVGFTVTAMSIIATSSFSKHLYKLEDENDNSKTLLHILVGQFRTSTFAFISTVGLILLFKFLPKETVILFTVKSYSISFNVIVKATIWYMTIISFITFFSLFKTFTKFVIKSATQE